MKVQLRLTTVAILGASVVFTLTHCRKDKGKDSSAPDNQGPAAPADWNGTSDWSLSSLEIVDE